MPPVQLPDGKLSVDWPVCWHRRAWQCPETHTRAHTHPWDCFKTEQVAQTSTMKLCLQKTLNSFRLSIWLLNFLGSWVSENLMKSMNFLSGAGKNTHLTIYTISKGVKTCGVLQVWILSQQHQHFLGTYQKCPTPKPTE